MLSTAREDGLNICITEKCMNNYIKEVKVINAKIKYS